MKTYKSAQLETNDFRKALSGDLLLPEDDGYHEARSVWNGMIDRQPAVIAQCEGVEDVIASVLFAKSNGLVTTGGIVSTTGVAGLTLEEGIGT